MMLMNQVLDSSDSLCYRDGDRCSLKRSASVASLPTPPRTFHKRSRSRARSDEHSEETSPDRKKRRTLAVLPGHDEDEEDENAFWTGRGGASKSEEIVTQADSTVESSPSPAILRYRVKAPVSPPPSRRQPPIQPARAASVGPDISLDSVVPMTPPRRRFSRGPSNAVDTLKTPSKSKTKIWPKRDSPNNPFLVDSSDKEKLGSEWDSSDEEPEVVGEARLREESPTPTYEEKPMITYVFRGQKATFHNPLYGLAPEVIAASKLPIDHPDYEATEACPPKKLFFSVGKQRSRDRSRERDILEGIKFVKGEPSRKEAEFHKRTSDVDDAEVVPPPTKSAYTNSPDMIDGGREKRERKETAAKMRLASRDGLRTGAIFTERDEPARRAMGPLRSV